MEDARLALGFPGLGASPGKRKFSLFLHQPESPICPDLAVGRTLALFAMVQTGTGAVPGPQPLGALLDAGGCHLAQFKSLSPQELRANLLPSLCPDLMPCPRLFPRTWEVRQLQVWERPVALEAELALTLKVLGSVADGSQGDILDQPLHTLRHMHSELQAVSAQSEAGPRPQGRLHHRVQCLHEAPKKSLGCLEASVLFNLFRLLTRDLKRVTSGDLCV
ncbi:interferon lambda-3-like [Prionailurus viverrinus]|uniref:interferon lambda-3-like n=1 Tax=Prionailurus viverrinus TaxID=61388 RepID=UPI001FF6ED32|nr:interferon lambda-3-like [Prionailurus viverrinus]